MVIGNMAIKEETRIMFSTHDDDQVEETLITKASMEKYDLKSAKVKMEEVREENERLKQRLSQIMTDYNSLKVQFNGVIQEDQLKNPTNSTPMAASDDESELVSLSLGMFSGESRRDQMKTESNCKILESSKLDGLELGLDWKSTLGNSTKVSKNPKLDESKGERNDDVHACRRSPVKTSRSGDDEILQHNPLKKPRVSVRTVCNSQTMHDGCQWRKYGQKIAKGNPCPRAYYRCTGSSSCPVRKQVQRSIDDMSILITTYEGTHNHQLPPSAASMASATSSAAAMLNCGSSSSSSASSNPLAFNFPRATISTSLSHPTVILDLTAPNHSSQSNLFSASHSSLNFASFNSSFDPKFPILNNAESPYFSNDRRVAAATKAITCDPSFQSALAAAITSFVGTSSSVHQGRGSGLNFNLNFSQSSQTNGTANAQQQNLAHFAPLTLSASKSQVMSLADDGEQINL